ncbi:MAG: RagB/SusD family nutrient uptake outer membrane protein, partial [Ginsengibacter sp.]
MKPIIKILSLCLVTCLTVLTGCKKDWLNEQPLGQISDVAFWKTSDDAMQGLTAAYKFGIGVSVDNYNVIRGLLGATDDSRFKTNADFTMGLFEYPSESIIIGPTWKNGYRAVFMCNVFLENVTKVQMDEALKAQMIAEVRFIRANQYFWLLQYYGGVPLVTKQLSIDEANTVTRNTRKEIVDFCLTELAASAKDLPASRNASEKGRIIKGAPLAELGRLLMIEKRWSEAASAFKQIIDLNVHIIDPSYQKISREEGENSKEIIFSRNYIAGLDGNNTNQKNLHPAFYGGYQENNAFQNLIDDFLMKDGLTISQSPLYNSDKPFENRDPRLYYNMFLPEYTMFRGTLYLGNPALTSFGIKSLIGATGYGCKKYITENYSGDIGSSGDDVVYIRYAEVLLSYLESKLEAGDPITQDLLDETINKVRGRAEVQMPPVTETDQVKLREIVRRERRVELCWEPLIRWMDIHRWGIASEVINKKFYGMKLTDDPANYTAYPVNSSGHLFSVDKTGYYKTPANDLWPIPQSEIDSNPNLEQNPG